MTRFSSAAKICSFLVLISASGFCQNSTTETSYLDSAVQHAVSIYDRQISGNSRLYNGVEYKEYQLKKTDIGDPYYLSNDLENGSIDYDGQLYTDVEMRYNIVRDKIIIEHTYSHFNIQLINEKVKSFSFLNHRFVNLVGDSSNASSIRTGFYDLLYDGNVKVYAKRRKDMEQRIESSIVITAFEAKDQYFIFKNNKYYRVTGKASALKVFYDRKATVKKLLVKNKINFRKNKEHGLINAASFYDQSAN